MPRSCRWVAIDDAMQPVILLAAAWRRSRSPGRSTRGVVRRDGVVIDVITGTDDEVDRIVDRYPFDISLIDDDRPFFWHFTGFGSVLSDWDQASGAQSRDRHERLVSCWCSSPR